MGKGAAKGLVGRGTSPVSTLAGEMGARRLPSAWSNTGLGQPAALPPSRDCPGLRLPVSKLGTVIPAHPSPGVIRKLKQALAPGRDLKGKALPGDLARTLNVEVPKDFTKGSFPFPSVDSSLTSGPTQPHQGVEI